MAHCRLALFSAILIGLSFVSGCSDNEGPVEKLQTAGQKAFLNGKYAEARRNFLRGLALKPSDRGLLFFTGLSYKRDYLYDSALIYLKRADILYPGDHEINLELYETAIATNSYNYAINAIHILNKTGDPEIRRINKLIELYAATEDPMNVVFYARRAIRLQPDSISNYLRLVGALIAVDSVQTAESMSDSAFARFGERDELIALKANVAAYKGDYQGAERVFRTLIEKSPAEAHRYKMNLANVLSMQSAVDKRKEALSLYREIKGQFGPQFKIDSLIQALESELQ